MKHLNTRNVKLNFGNAGKIIVCVTAVGFETAQFHNIIEHGHELVQHFGECLATEHIVKGCNAVANNLCIHCKELRKVAVLEIKNFKQAQLLQGKEIDIGNTFTAIVLFA